MPLSNTYKGHAFQSVTLHLHLHNIKKQNPTSRQIGPLMCEYDYISECHTVHHSHTKATVYKFILRYRPRLLALVQSLVTLALKKNVL